MRLATGPKAASHSCCNNSAPWDGFLLSVYAAGHHGVTVECKERMGREQVQAKYKGGCQTEAGEQLRAMGLRETR